MADIDGTNATEPLDGTGDPDTIRGFGGADTIDGLDGADTISGGDGGDTIFGGDGADVIYGHSVDDLVAGSADITATLLAEVGFGAVFVTGAPGDSGFVYAVSKDAGEIVRINTSNGAQTSFLDIPGTEFSSGGERGLLGLAFHPDYATNGRFFVYLTNPSGDIEVREYARSVDPTVANATVVQSIITIPHPTFANHNGGSLVFGPDGYLYIATGDGGGGNDPGENAQNIDALLGKLLRIDVDSDGFPADATRNYAIPAGNPFAGVTPGADEIWDYGLRNPWRISFDPATGDLYIGDVGQGAREEVDFEAAGGSGGVNYGWDHREGTIAGPSGAPNPPIAFTDPVYDYSHAVGHSITGGYVYRGPADGLTGAYFFADFVTARLFSLRVVNGVAEDASDRTVQVTGTVLQSIASFGTDNSGNLYVVSLDGSIHRLDPGATSGDGDDTLDGGAGDDVINAGWGADLINGGSGADTMRGGAGNDIYVVDSLGDTVDELQADAGGIDVVRSSVSFSLGTSAHVLGTLEHLFLTGNTGVAGAGNGGVNSIVGNSGANLLDGRGGADLMRGMAGNDSYVVDNAGDTVDEAWVGSSGIDTVQSFLGFNLVSSAHVRGSFERLTLLGSANINGTGNALNNKIQGNGAANVLSGAGGSDTMLGGYGNDSLNGGAASDVMTGGGGSDAFVFNAPLGTVDRITDFNVAADSIRLENAVFTRIVGTGGLTANQFARNPTGLAHDRDDRIIYEVDTGRLIYDVNGNAPGGSMHFATLTSGLGVTQADFVII